PAALSKPAAGGRPHRRRVHRPRATRDKTRGCRLDWQTACDSLGRARPQARTIPGAATMNEWLDDFKTAVAFLTRLPMPHPQGAIPENFVRAHRMFPVVGALIGAAVGFICLALRWCGVPDFGAAALALGASAILTGALHEDGLA